MSQLTTPHVPTVDAVKDAMKGVRARLRGHAGDLEIVDISEEGEVTINFIGACSACPAIGFTFGAIVEPSLMAIEGVSSIKTHQVHMSPAVRRRLQAMTEGQSPAVQW